MNLDDLEDFLDNLLSTGVSLDSMSFDDLTTLMADADIDVSELSDDQIQKLMEMTRTELEGDSVVEQPTANTSVRFGSSIHTDAWGNEWKTYSDGSYEKLN